MEQQIQLFILQQKVLYFLSKMLESEETAIEKKTILKFSQALHNFFSRD